MSVLNQNGRIQALGILARWQLTSHALYYKIPYLNVKLEDLKNLKISEYINFKRCISEKNFYSRSLLYSLHSTYAKEYGNFGKWSFKTGNTKFVPYFMNKKLVEHFLLEWVVRCFKLNTFRYRKKESVIPDYSNLFAKSLHDHIFFDNN